MALHGMRTWNGSGQLTMEISDRLTQHVGYSIISGNGSIYVPEANDGRDIWCFVSDVLDAFNSNTRPPRVYVNQDTNQIIWSSLSDGPTHPDRSVQIVWGVY